MVTLTEQIEKLNLPALYETDGLDFEYPVRLTLGETGYEWFLSEYDPVTKEAFGYANLNDPEMSELGYISIVELEGIVTPNILEIEGVKLNMGSIKVTIDKNYNPVKLDEIKKKVYERYV